MIQPVNHPRSLSTPPALLGVILSLTVVLPASADDAELVTDRPDFTESAVVVPRGSVQLEAGATWLELDELQTLSGPEALLRWGFVRALELRIGLPDYVDFDLPRGGDSDWSDSSLGIKWQLGPDDAAWGFAVIAELELPTGTVEATADTVDPGLVLSFGADLSDRWSLGVQGSAARETVVADDGDEGLGVYGGTVVLGLGVGERTGTFLELAAFSLEGEDTELLIHHGWTWLVRTGLQLDAHIAAGLTDVAPDWLVGAGLSTRW